MLARAGRGICCGRIWVSFRRAARSRLAVVAERSEPVSDGEWRRRGHVRGSDAAAVFDLLERGVLFALGRVGLVCAERREEFLVLQIRCNSLLALEAEVLHGRGHVQTGTGCRSGSHRRRCRLLLLLLVSIRRLFPHWPGILPFRTVPTGPVSVVFPWRRSSIVPAIVSLLVFLFRNVQLRQLQPTLKPRMDLIRNAKLHIKKRSRNGQEKGQEKIFLEWYAAEKEQKRKVTLTFLWRRYMLR